MSRTLPLWQPPGDWIEDGLCAVLGHENWDSLSSEDQRAVCGGCPVIEECAAWASQYEWSGATVAGRTHHSCWTVIEQRRRRGKVPDQTVKV